MPVDSIYHYTSIESLALILKTRKLRFTRLDGVDDVREAQAHAGINFGKFLFVSCWTQQAEESIPQWSMYSREMQGVRLELPAFPFTNDPLRPKPGWGDIEWQGGLLSSLSFDALWGPSYFIVPMFINREHFAGPVKYVPSVSDVYADSIRREVLPDGRISLKIDGLPPASPPKVTRMVLPKGISVLTVRTAFITGSTYGPKLIPVLRTRWRAYEQLIPQ